MKKIVIYFATLSFLIFVFSGCEDFLTHSSLTSYDESNYPNKVDDVRDLLTGTYAAMERATLDQDGDPHSIMVAEILCDDRYGGGGRNDIFSQALNHFLLSTRSFFNSQWVWNYRGIARSMTVMAALESNMPEGPERTNFEAQAKFLRAYFYYALVRDLENIPILEELPATVEDAMEIPDQAHPDDVYKLIATDLWFAYNNLPAVKWDDGVYKPHGVVTKWAAASYLARIFLFYTGFYQKPDLPREGGTVTKQDIIAMLEDVINNSGHSLVPDFRSLWPYTNKLTKPDYPYVANDNVTLVEDGKNPEHVFVIKCAPYSNGANTYALCFGLRDQQKDYRTVFPLGKGWGMGPVSTNIWNEWVSYEPDDMRRQASIWKWDLETLDPDTWTTDPTKYPWGRENQMEETGLWNKKIVSIRAFGKRGDPKSVNNTLGNLWYCFESDPTMWNRSGDDLQRGNGQDLIIVRFADVLLMHSELTETVTGINRVRVRAGLPQRGAYSFEDLQRERRFELCFEGHRWNDIRRWHIEHVLGSMYGEPIRNNGVELVMKQQGNAGNTVERYRQTRGFWMIPETQIRLSGFKLKQNAGWTADIDWLYSGYQD